MAKPGIHPDIWQPHYADGTPRFFIVMINRNSRQVRH
jgi:hypothetical protein